MSVSRWLATAAVLGSLTCGTVRAQAQDGAPLESVPSSGQEEAASETEAAAGPSVQAYVTFDANNSGTGTWLQVTPSGGVTFNERWSLEAGLPIYYLNAGSTEEGASQTGIGDLYLSVSFDMSADETTLSATGTVGVPTGSAEEGLGSGTTTWDVSGHLDKTFGRITPSVYAGVGNNSVASASDPARQLYRSEGYLFHVEGWAEVEVWKSVSLSAGVYAVRPTGSESEAPTGPDPDLDESGYDDSASDEGFQFVGAASLTRYLDLSMWFSRSHAFAYNTYSLSLGLDLAGLMRRPGASAPTRKRVRR